MLILYYKPTCAFSQRVLSAVEEMGLKMDLRDISSDPTLEQQLLERGGKDQTPYLVDQERQVEMYESNDIISYLMEHYASGANAGEFNGLRIHQTDEACDTCQ